MSEDTKKKKTRKPRASKKKTEKKPEEKKEEVKTQTEPQEKTEIKTEEKTKAKPVSASETMLSPAEAEALAEAAAKSATARLAAAKLAAEAAAEEEHEAARLAAEAIAESTALTEAGRSFTDKREKEQIFRREMGEPEFFQTKKDLIPMRPIISPEEEEEISRKVEIPTGHIPQYKPEIILSPEYGGTSNYEVGIKTVKEEVEEKLHRLRNDPDVDPEEIRLAEEDLKTLDNLYQNYYIGMNVFRTAKGGREKIRE